MDGNGTGNPPAHTTQANASLRNISLPLPSPANMSLEESISLEETNKIRISLGLKPLTEDAPTSNDKDKQAEDNYAKRRQRDEQERESKYISFLFVVILFLQTF